MILLGIISYIQAYSFAARYKLLCFLSTYILGDKSHQKPQVLGCLGIASFCLLQNAAFASPPSRLTPSWKQHWCWHAGQAIGIAAAFRSAWLLKTFTPWRAFSSCWFKEKVAEHSTAGSETCFVSCSHTSGSLVTTSVCSCTDFVCVCALVLNFFLNVPPVTGALLFSARCSGCSWPWQAPEFKFSSLCVRRGAQVLFYFCTQGSEVCAATELAEERRSFASAVVLLGERAYRISL